MDAIDYSSEKVVKALQRMCAEVDEAMRYTRQHFPRKRLSLQKVDDSDCAAKFACYSQRTSQPR
jgi:hypothetical protein